MADVGIASSNPSDRDGAGELMSTYGEEFRLVSCSSMLGSTYPTVASGEATLWNIYPELLAPDLKMAVESVLATGLPRSMTVPGSGSGRKLFVFRAERGVGVMGVGEAAVQASGSETDERVRLLHQAMHDPLTDCRTGVNPATTCTGTCQRTHGEI